MFSVSADPTVAFVDAFKAPLVADSTLSALVTGVYGYVSDKQRTSFPYLVLGRRSRSDTGAMQIAGHRLTLQLDGWSQAKGAYEMSTIGSRVFALMERRRGFTVPGFDVIDGSLTCELTEVFDEPDADKPEDSLFRLMQRWAVEIHGR